MAHKHSVYDSDIHLRINPTTRGFVQEGFAKTVIVQYDHNSERFTFELPRFIEGHDMLECNSVQVHYLNVDANTQETANGVFVVTDLQESPEDENIAIFSWLISSNATKYVGSLNFCIRFACISEENTVDYAWNTAVNTTMRVTDGINNAEVVIQEYADVLEQWKQDITSNIYDFLPEHLQIGSEMAEILPPTELFYEDGMFGVMGHIEGVEIGETYTVNYNGVDYECTAQLVEGAGNTATVLGNVGAVLGSGDNGQPFVLIIIPPEEFVPSGVGGMFMTLDGATSVTLSISYEKIKPIDTKYLPKHLQFGETQGFGDTLTWDGDTTGKEITGNGLMVKVSDVVPTIEDFTNGATVTISNAMEMDVTEEVRKSSDGKCIRIGLFATIALEDYTDGSNVYTKGTYFYKNTSNGDTVTKLKINGYKGFTSTVVKPIEMKYLPEPIIFTTTDMQSATCNKTYQECVEAINNNCLGVYLKMSVEGETTIFLSAGYSVGISLFASLFDLMGMKCNVIYNNNDGSITIEELT